jgi:hypothetical protein
MPKNIVKTRQAFDFLALVPQLLGFLPEKCIVLVAFRGNRTCGAMRFNLPDPAAPVKVHKRVATTLIGTLCKIPGVDAVVPVAYTDDSFGAVPGIPHERFAEALVARAELSGFLVRDALCVGADGWGSYLDPECPAGGHPLSDIAASAVHEAIPAESRRDLATLRSGADLPTVDLAVKERLARRFAGYQRLGSGSPSSPELIDLVGDLLDPVETAEAALNWDATEVQVDDAAALLFLVQGPANRDQIMLQFAFGEQVGIQAYELNVRYLIIQRATGRSMDDIVRDEYERSAGGDPDARRTSDLMLGLGEERPDAGRIERAIALLKTLVAMAPRSARPAPLCMLAWLSWSLGRGSVAGIFIDAALAIDPGYSMAGLLDAVVCSGYLPEWAFAVPFDDDARA